MTSMEKLEVKIHRTETCWHWVGRIEDNGYGTFSTKFAHRLVYAAMVGPIPAGMTIDHMCHNADLNCLGGDTCLHRRCVRPDHLRVVTGVENARGQAGARATHCKNGHAYTEANTYWRPVGYRTGRRDCRRCIALRVAKYKAVKTIRSTAA